ncbi:MAG: hypothetical protein AAF351_06450 [Pseudomonadota bacterium]
MLWVIMGLMLATAIVFVVWPLFKADQTLSLRIAGTVVVVIAMAAGIYSYQGRPEVPSGASQQPDINAMVASLAERLQNNPNDPNGWLMLGRSYMTLENYAGAVNAYERAMALESPQRADTMVNLGRALLARDEGQVVGRAAALFESALAIEPNHPWGLFFGGAGAGYRGDLELAANRWEMLLSTNVDPQMQQLLEQGIARWRGQPEPAVQPTPEREGTILAVQIALGAGVEVSPTATVFVIARDPAQPSPPIAVARRRVAELPITVSLGDADSMIPGRSLSGFSNVEVVARVSVSGQPIAQSGDWFAVTQVQPAESAAIELTIDQQVP